MNCPRCEEICRCPSELPSLPQSMWGQPPAVQSSEARGGFASASMSQAVDMSQAIEESGSAALSWTAEGGCPHTDQAEGGCPHTDQAEGGCPHTDQAEGGCPHTDQAEGCPSTNEPEA